MGKASRLVALVSLGWGIACAAPVDVVQAPGADLSGLRRWSWDPAGVVVEASADAPALRAAVARVVEDALAARGFTRDDRAPEIWVQARVSIQSRVAVVRVPMAPYLLNSLNASASYLVEGSQLERRFFEDLRLGIGIRRPSGATIWRAVTGYSVEHREARGLDEGIARLVARVPRAEGGVTRPAPAPGWPGETPPATREERLAADTGR